MVIIERSIPVHVYWQNCNEQSSARLSLTKKISDKNYIIVRRCWQNTQELGSDIVTLLNPPPPKKELTQTIFCIFISTHTHTHQKKREKKKIHRVGTTYYPTVLLLFGCLADQRHSLKWKQIPTVRPILWVHHKIIYQQLSLFLYI